MDMLNGSANASLISLDSGDNSPPLAPNIGLSSFKEGGLPMPPMFPAFAGEMLISEQLFDMVETVINVYIINGLSVVGSIGNVLSIIVLSIDGFKNSANMILISMAVADLLIVLTIPLRKISLIVAYFDTATAIQVESYVVYYNFLTFNRTWSLISNSHVAIIAIERLIAVYFPFQVSRWITGGRTAVVVVLTHIIWYIALVPLFAMFDLNLVFAPELNTTVAVLAMTSFYSANEELFNDYHSYFINIFVGALLLLVTLVCCIAVAIKVIKMGERRKYLAEGVYNSRQSRADGKGQSDVGGKESQSREKQNEISTLITSTPRVSPEDTPQLHVNESVKKNKLSRSKSTKSKVDMKVVKMLMTVCIAFLILIFPTFLLAFFQGLYPQLRDPYWQRVNFVATSVSMLLVTINSSINFVIYIFYSQRFHNILVDICFNKKR